MVSRENLYSLMSRSCTNKNACGEAAAGGGGSSGGRRGRRWEEAPLLSSPGLGMETSTPQAVRSPLGLPVRLLAGCAELCTSHLSNVLGGHGLQKGPQGAADGFQEVRVLGEV